MADRASKVVILGIGDDGLAGLTEAARQVVLEADRLLGDPDVLELLSEVEAERIPLSSDMSSAVEMVKSALERAERPVLVSSGDPLFYGIARYVCDRLGKDQFEIIPHVSSMQLAFARVKESWDDAYLSDLGNRSLEATLNRIRVAEKVGLFSSPKCPPAKLARAMLDRGLDNFRVYVCENLGSPDERVTQAELSEIEGMSFDPLHIIILVRKRDEAEGDASGEPRLVFGNSDELFHHNQPRRSLVTTAEVRALALAQLNLGPDAVVWDVGAGSGSVAIEAARLCPAGTVYAIEPRGADRELIRQNVQHFGVSNIQIVAGRAPRALRELPTPEAVFVGGTGRHVGAILKESYERLRPQGRLAVNVASIEGLAESHRLLKGLAGDVSLWSVSIARGMEQLDRIRFQALNPSFLLAVGKPGGASD